MIARTLLAASVFGVFGVAEATKADSPSPVDLPPVRLALQTAVANLHKNRLDYLEANNKVLTQLEEVLQEQATKALDAKRFDDGEAISKMLSSMRADVLAKVEGQKWEVNGHYYMVFNIRNERLGISWEAAKQKCEELGGYLACGETPEEREYLNELGVGWVGCSRAQDGRWLWLTGEELKPAPNTRAGWDYLQSEGLDSEGKPKGFSTRPMDGVRGTRMWTFICEWDE